MSRLPLVIILGATGSGKTRLSLEIAQRFQTEVIGADSMQIYKGLNIVTAKPTQEEQTIAKHHMIDILNPDEKFTVFEYRNRALKIIEDLIKRHKLAIVVGGTNYYIESLLWKILIEAPSDHIKVQQPDPSFKDYELSSEELYKKLQQVDPKMAQRLHPNNKRKLLRSLEVLYSIGRPHSELLEEQQKAKGASQSGGGLRFKNALIFKLHCDQNVLDERLNQRIDKMIDDGLLEELLSFQNNINGEIDFSNGVFQSIGFKEFHSYLIMNDLEKESECGRKELQKCIEAMKLQTRRYARKQNKWTNNRFLGRLDREVPPMYGLDVTDLNKWTENVLEPSIEIINSFQNQSTCRYQPLKMFDCCQSKANAEDETFICETCQRLFVGHFQWSIHLKSRKHKNKAKKNYIS